MERKPPRVVDAEFTVVQEKRPPIWRRYEIYLDKTALMAGLIGAALYALQLLRHS